MKNREKQIQTEIEALCAERETLRKNRFWCCTLCNRKTKIKSLEVTVFYRYGIDDWEPSGLYEIACPKCNEMSSGWVYTDNVWRKVYESLNDFKKIVKKDRSSGSII